jgi:hypothetical protein
MKKIIESNLNYSAQEKSGRPVGDLKICAFVGKEKRGMIHRRTFQLCILEQ